MIVMLAVILLACYLVGGVPFGFLIGRARGMDIRQHGSGNIGATNVWRVFGKKLGLTCFALDFLKGCLPVLAVQFLTRRADPALATWGPLVAVLGTVAGHVWTPYLRFRGGKGIATSAGAVLAVACLPVVGALLIWVLVVKLTRFVSLASISAALALPLAAMLLNQSGYGRYDKPVLLLLLAIGTLAVFRHHSNIRRLLAGTEPRTNQRPAVTTGDSKPDTTGASKS
jgi:acyl phosphate:glycerol-3-phosphate acyltransferase